MVGSPTPGGDRHLRVAVSARALKRQLGPMAWAVLEDVALDAALDEAGRLVATTSTRRVAENLALTPGTAARALGRLRSLGLMSYARQDGPAGRFGLSAYVLGPLPGIEVRTGHDEIAEGSDHAGTDPGVNRPGTAGPRAARPRPVEPRVGDTPMVASPAVAAGRRRRAAVASPPGFGQLDLLGYHSGSQQDPTQDRS